MKKLLLEMNFRLRNIEEYNIIKNKFIQNGYENLEIKEFNQRELNINFLYNYINTNNLKKIYNKIVFISNIEDVVFIWYRLYNFLVDDFIFFIDKYNYNLFNGEILERIASMESIEKEKLDKIYVNFSDENIKKTNKIFKNINNLKFLESIENFIKNEMYRKIKNESRKTYIFNEIKIDNGIENRKEEIIEIEVYKNIKDSVEDLTQIIILLSDIILDNTELALYYFMSEYLNQMEKTKEEKKIIPYFIIFFEYLTKTGRKDRAFDKIIESVEKIRVDFLWKIQICQLLVTLGCKDYRILKLSIKCLKENIDKDLYHYCILMQLFFNSYSDKVHVYEEFNKDMSDIIKQLSYKYTEKIEIEVKENRKDNKKKIAIIVDQLNEINHSTAKATLDHAININKYLDNIEVMIFVEDNFLQCEQERILISQYFSTYSQTKEKFHKEYMESKNNKGIKIFYSDVNKIKRDRVIEIISNVIEYNPNIILNMNNAYSLSMEYLSKIFNSYYITMGMINWQENQIYNFYSKAINKKQIPNFNNNIFFKTRAIELEKKPNKYLRGEFGIDEEDFVMIGVSLIPETDFDNVFFENISKILRKYKKTKLIIVGSKNLKIVDEKYSDLKNEKIVFIEYEQELGKLYQICDIYLNPFRQGGGYSIAEAMFYGLPILTLKGCEAGESWSGEKNSVNDFKEYVNKIEKIIQERKYKEELSQIMQERINNSGYEKHFDEIFEYIKI